MTSVIGFVKLVKKKLEKSIFHSITVENWLTSDTTVKYVIHLPGY